MYDLPSVNKKILPLAVEIQLMRRGGGRENQKPHKLLMILAVLDLIDHDLLHDNRIYLNQQLISSFEKHFRQYATKDDWCQPGPPFFHLRGTSFWKHKIKAGREEAYSKLQTSGGGIKRIHDNIDYAEMDERIFNLLKDSRLRKELRDFIITLLGESNNMIQTNRLPTVFHEDFAFSRPSVIQVINALQDHPKDIDFRSRKTRGQYFRDKTQLGTNYVKAMPEYAKGAGLLDFSYNLTLFASTAIKRDPLLEYPSTQWLMHYHLSAHRGPGPIFWHTLVASRFRSGDKFTQEDLAERIGTIYKELKGTALSERKICSTANIFLGTYTRREGLGNLGILQETGKNVYEVLTPEAPPTWAVAFAVLHTWQTLYPQQATVNLKDITTESGLATIFMISRSRLEMILGEMQSERIVELFRVAPPYQVALLHSDLVPVLERMYAYDQRG